MKKTTLLLLVFSMLTLQFSAQNQNPKKEKKEKKVGRTGAETSTISLEELLKNPNGSYIITSENVSKRSGVHNLYLRQAINGLEVYGTESSIHFDRSGKVLVEHNKFLQNAASTVKNSSQGISAKQAIVSVARKMDYTVSDLQEIQNLGGANQASLYNKGGISSENIPVRLMYYFREGIGTQLIWELSISEKKSSDWWNFRVDAATGQIIDKDNWTISCNILGDHKDHAAPAKATPFVGPNLAPANNQSYSAQPSFLAPAASYRVYAMPLESPNYGTRTLVTNPENLDASPFGWHDVDGIEGAEFTYTRGNNAEAYDDDNDNDLPDGKHAFSPGGNLIFDFPLNTNYSFADQSENAAITNLFYWTNIIHDVAYQYGFDEVSGNFQQNNYGNGGLGNDPVNAEAQDGSGTCNANFGTPPDGFRPTMQMYVCNNRDGDLDNGVIVHEYGHGISVRLTGGPADTGCLWNDEQMGEGWSDYYSLMLTMTAADAGTDSRGIGTWLIGEPAGGPGIRNYPYSTNFAVNPHTYNDIKIGWSPHDVGEVWATMLWEMTWEIMQTEPFNPDIYNGTGGNNVSLAIVTEGLKLQPCSPGFIDARDAILAADQVLYGGSHICAIWEAFARRGLGYSANQGSSNSRTDGTQAFDLPPSFSSLSVVDEICLSNGIQTGLSGGNPAGGVYSGPGVTDDGNGLTFTFDPSVPGSGPVIITYMVNDFCTGAPTSLTDEIEVTNNPPAIICAGSGLIPMSGSETSSPGAPIPDGNASGVTVTMNVTENISISDLNVNLNISHAWVGDVIVTVKSPSGTSAIIMDRPGRTSSGYGCSGDDIVATLDDQALTPVENECSSSIPTINGSFIPNNPLAIFNGESTMGTWELKVVDSDYGFSGTINSWGIEYGYEIEAPVFTVVLDESGNATINSDELLFSAAVDCGSYSVLAGSPLAGTLDFTCSNIGMNNIPIEVTNDSGAVSSCVAQVLVVDTSNPILSCPADQTHNPGAGNFYPVPDYFASGEATATDNCTNPIIVTSQSPAPGTLLGGGTFVVTLTAEDESANSTTCTFILTVDSLVGIEEQNASLVNIQIFPNPVKNTLILAKPLQLSLEELKIYDMRGRMIKSINLQNSGTETSIDVSGMASSIYFIKIQGKDGQITKRFIKE